MIGNSQIRLKPPIRKVGMVKNPLNNLVRIFLVSPKSKIVDKKNVSPIIEVVYVPLNRKLKTNNRIQITIPINE